MKVEEGDWVIILGRELGYRIGYVEDVRPNWLDNDFEDVTIQLGHSTLEIKSYEISAVLTVKPEEEEPEEVIPSPEEVAEALKTMPGTPVRHYSPLAGSVRDCGKDKTHKRHDYLFARKRYTCEGS